MGFQREDAQRINFSHFFLVSTTLLTIGCIGSYGESMGFGARQTWIQILAILYPAVLFSWTSKSLWMVTVAMKLKHSCSLDVLKATTNVDSVLKSRDITLTTKVPILKAMVFPVVMHRCENSGHKEG